MSDAYPETIFGQILPMDWNEDDVVGLIILVDGEDEFIVEPDKTGRKLFDHVDRWVTAKGLIREDEDEMRIMVRDYTLEDEDWNYMDEDRW
ncbi:hypothetical protein [Salidesulfovibrio onnuriiensis]|uniref:hypothetical protein n=1 Tax=Salidesulfovibrio onnuriiensis TaxID=2583823 RepID=UPI0011C77EC9|nr:hypothetical protein [Salidesulfovibrio onnuriiensis]